MKIINKFSRDLSAVFILLATVYLFFFFKLEGFKSIFITPDYGLSDLINFNYPIKYELFKALHNNHLPLWTNFIGGGFPLMGEGQVGALNVTNLALFRIFDFVTAINSLYVVIFMSTALGVYIYARILGLRPLTGIFMGLVFAFSGFFVGHTTHINVIQAASYLPWILVFAHLILDSKFRLFSTLALGFLIGQQFFAGFPQMVLLSLLVSATYVGYGAFKKRTVRPLIFFCISAALGFLIILPQLWISIEYLQQSGRKGGLSLQEVLFFSFPVKNFLTFLNPYIIGDIRAGTYPPFWQNNGGIFWENMGYIGVIPLILALFSLGELKKNVTVRFFWFLAIMSLLLMLGKNSPLYLVYSFFPFNFFRVPSRFILTLIFSIVLLSGFGLQTLLAIVNQRLNNKKIILGISMIMITLSIFSVMKTAYDYGPVGNAAMWLSKPETAKYLADTENVRIYSTNEREKWNQIFLKEGWADWEPFYQRRNNLNPNSNTLYDVPGLGLYAAFMPGRTESILGMLSLSFHEVENGEITLTKLGEKLLQVNSISHLLTPAAITERELTKKVELKNDNDFYIYKIDSSAPIRLSQDPRYVNTIKEAMSEIEKPNFDPKRSVLLESKIDLGVQDVAGERNEVEIKESSTTNLKVVATSKSKSVLVFSNSFYPGWSATVDGEGTKIMPANVNQMAIIVPPGDHKIEFQYKPKYFFELLWLSIFVQTIIVLAIILLLCRLVYQTARTKP